MRLFDKRLISLAVAAVAAVAISGCSHQRQHGDVGMSASNNNQQPSVDEARHNSAVIHFKRGDATLTADDEENLRTLVNDQTQSGNIDRIELAVWSDKQFPAN